MCASVDKDKDEDADALSFTFHLRRAALRALSQQSSSLSRTYQPASRLTSFPQSGSQSIAWRGFHQSRIWRVEEEQKGDIAKEGAASPAENEDPAETVKVEPSAEEQREVQEESIATPDVADAAQQESTAEAVAEKAEEVASTTTENFSQAAQAATAAASSAGATDSSGSFHSRQPQGATTFRSPRPSRILYIGNLYFEVNAQQLEAEFAPLGRVTNSRIVTDSRGLSKGFGYIEMESQEAADTAVRNLNQREFQGRRMAVQYHVPRERTGGGPGGHRLEKAKHPPSKTLFIGNMSYQMSDRDLNDLFREIRDVLDVRVAIDRRSGQPRGFAHADFIDVAAAERAKEHLEQKVVYGRQLRIDFSASAGSSGRS